MGELDTTRPPAAGLGGRVPSRGAFASSEVIPLVQAAARRKAEAHTEYSAAAERAATAKATARKVRADLIVRLRVFGNDDVGVPIKTSVERNEWADADPSVQSAEREADLAAILARSARMAWEDADSEFQVLRTLLGMERDAAKMHADWGDG